jgi:hypothetical protein
MRTGLSTFTLLCALFAASVKAAAPAPAATAAPNATDAGSAATASAAPVLAQQQEVMDSTDAAPPAPQPAPAAAAEPPKAPPPPTSDSATTAADTATSAPPPKEEFTLRNDNLYRLDLSGTMQLKAFYHDMFADRDEDKSLSYELRRFKVELDGSLNGHFGFRGELLVDGNNRQFGVDNAYLYYLVNDMVGFRGGKQKRPFSMEALQSPKYLYTIERGALYFNFLANTTGYSYFDLGFVGYGGFNEDGIAVTYELGLFNGKQNDTLGRDYRGQQDVDVDEGFKAKDIAMRLTIAPWSFLTLEAALSTKSADDKSDPADFGYAVNTAYELGADFNYKHLRLLGEVAWGDNQNTLDQRIIDGSSDFLTFYVTGVWHEDYKRGRASELVLKFEALDPTFEWGDGEGTPNDGKVRYTAGVNWFFTPQVSVMADYGILQPITKVEGEDDLIQDVDLLWRLNF